MLKGSALSKLQNKKNLLAFSAGVDSTALFFLLTENSIEFDIAIVDYNKRAQSKDEVAYAKELSEKHNKTIHVKSVHVENSNFEKRARDIRYEFFDELMSNYDNLIMAHHLGDNLEWFLMRFCKGSGCEALAGMQEVSQRKKYNIIRPLLHVDKSELLEYLHVKNFKYFIDESNEDEKYERNYFRHNFSDKLLKEYKSGILKSFEYMSEAIESLHVEHVKELSYFKSLDNITDSLHVDKVLKQRGFLMSSNDRNAIKISLPQVVGRKYVVAKFNDKIIIAPYIYATMDKEFKERCRLLKIEPKLRGYLYENQDIIDFIV
jgi:tRNA(Ile)-lysidine synthase